MKAFYSLPLAAPCFGKLTVVNSRPARSYLAQSLHFVVAPEAAGEEEVAALPVAALLPALRFRRHYRRRRHHGRVAHPFVSMNLSVDITAGRIVPHR